MWSSVDYDKLNKFIEKNESIKNMLNIFFTKGIKREEFNSYFELN